MFLKQEKDFTFFSFFFSFFNVVNLFWFCAVHHFELFHQKMTGFLIYLIFDAGPENKTLKMNRVS